MAYILTEMEPDELAFLNAILDAPDDDAPRLVYADWLDEHHQADQATLIRLQVRRPQAGGIWPREEIAGWRRLLGDGKADAARRWFPNLPVPVDVSVTFHRGLPEKVAVGPRCWDNEALAALCATLPVTSVQCNHLRDISPVLRAAASARGLARLHVQGTIFERTRGRAQHAAAVAALAALNMDGLIDLSIWNYPIDEALAGALARPHPLPRLRSLALIRGLVGSDATAALRDGFRPTQLTHLDLRNSFLNEEEVAVLADWPALATVTELDLTRNCIGPVGAAALADSPYLNGLKILDLADNQLGRDGGRRLANGRGLAALDRLDLRGAGAERAGQALRKRFRNVCLGFRS